MRTQVHGESMVGHLSTAKSGQQIQGALLKRFLAARLHIPPSAIFHVTVMPCYDRKLEASREQHRAPSSPTPAAIHSTPASELPPEPSTGPTLSHSTLPPGPGVPDVDLVLTSGELVDLLASFGVSLDALAHSPNSPTALIDHLYAQPQPLSIAPLFISDFTFTISFHCLFPLSIE